MRTSDARVLYVNFYLSSMLHQAEVNVTHLHKDGSEENVKHVLKLETEIGTEDLETWARDVLAEIIERL